MNEIPGGLPSAVIHECCSRLSAALTQSQEVTRIFVDLRLCRLLTQTIPQPSSVKLRRCDFRR